MLSRGALTQRKKCTILFNSPLHCKEDPAGAEHLIYERNREERPGLLLEKKKKNSGEVAAIEEPDSVQQIERSIKPKKPQYNMAPVRRNRRKYMMSPTRAKKRRD